MYIGTLNLIHTFFHFSIAPAQSFGAFAGPPQSAANQFNAFAAPAAPPQATTFDPFGGSTTQAAQPSQGGFAAFGSPQQQPSPFGAAPAASSSSFNAFGAPVSSGSILETFRSEDQDEFAEKVRARLKSWPRPRPRPRI